MTERILVVDDDADQCALMEAMLSRLGYVAETCSSASEALLRTTRTRFTAILTDLELGELSGIGLCEQLASTAPRVPIIVVTGHASVETVSAAIRAGAFDYLTKPVAANQLGLRLARAVRHGQMMAEVSRLRSSDRVEEGPALRGHSTPMRDLNAMIERVAATDASVLIQGETGTGKELVARAIHEQSARSAGAFVAINCAAVPASLLESELFGHARGAFTDAKTQRDGLFVQASGGTLFLDEIGEMPLDMQAKLLRALQERRVRPIGSDTEVPFDARVLTATHRDLEAEVDARRFRQDLFYRINVVRVDVPALRERRGDVLELAVHFLDRFTLRMGRPRMALSARVAERLMTYEWPGNVRELENCMERVTALGRFGETTPDDLPEQVRRHGNDAVTEEAEEKVSTLGELERLHILRVLTRVNGNKSRAAQLLGLDRRTLYRKLDTYAGIAAGGAS